MTDTVYIALGSNLGDRQVHLASALDAIRALPGVLSVVPSPIYETEPVLTPGSPAGQSKFLNLAAVVKTTLPPGELLKSLHKIEASCGRARLSEQWGNQPRTLDLDILLYGDKTIDEPGITIPHPRMHERWFVLKPLNDLAPDMIHPVIGRSISKLLADLEDKEASPQRHRDTEIQRNQNSSNRDGHG